MASTRGGKRISVPRWRDLRKFFFSSRRRHTRSLCDWSSDVCSSDLFLKVGQRVRVEYGPLSGLEGFLLNFKGRYRLVLSVSLLQRSVAVEVDSAWVTSIPQQPARTAPIGSSAL